MRSIFMVLSLLLTLAIVGVLVKKQLASGHTPNSTPVGLALPAQSPQEVQQQFKQALDEAMQPAKRDADEK